MKTAIDILQVVGSIWILGSLIGLAIATFGDDCYFDRRTEFFTTALI